MKIYTDAQAFIDDQSGEEKVLYSDQENVTVSLPIAKAVELLSPGTVFEQNAALPAEQTAFFFKLFGLVAKDPNVTIISSDETILANVETFNQNAEANGLAKIAVNQAAPAPAKKVPAKETPAPVKEAPASVAPAPKEAETPVKKIEVPKTEEKPTAKKGRPCKVEVTLVDESEGAVEKTEKFDDPVEQFIQDKFSESRNPILRGWTNKPEKIKWIANIFGVTRKKGARSSILVGILCQLDKKDADQVIDELYEIFKEHTPENA